MLTAAQQAQAQVQPLGARMAVALDRTAKHVYAGTVPTAGVKQRRAAAKVARQSRRTNRKRGA